MMESVVLDHWFAVSPEELWRGWLDSRVHAGFTGGEADIDPTPGGSFSAWDGYITGSTRSVDPPRRIVQAWRTSEFPPDAPDSRLELTFEPEAGGTRLTLRHTDLPEGQGVRYAQGWIEHYFEPMEIYFGRRT